MALKTGLVPLVAYQFPTFPSNDLIQVEENVEHFVRDSLFSLKYQFVRLPQFAQLIIFANCVGWLLWKFAPIWMKSNFISIPPNIAGGRFHSLVLNTFSNLSFVQLLLDMLFFKDLVKPLVADLGEPFLPILFCISAVGSNLFQATVDRVTGDHRIRADAMGFGAVNSALLYWHALMQPNAAFSFEIPEIFPGQHAITYNIGTTRLLHILTSMDLVRACIDLLFSGSTTATYRIGGLISGMILQFVTSKFGWAQKYIRWNKRSLLKRRVFTQPLF